MPTTDHPSSEAQPTDPPSKRISPLAWLWIVVVVLAFGGCIAAVSSSSGSKSDPTIEVNHVCRDFVKDRLKAPATADFGTGSVTSSGSTYTVVNTVDAENSFGAKIRSTYTCTVHDAGDKWVLDSLTGLD